MSCFEEKDGCIILNVKVIPGASNDAIQGIIGDALKVRIRALPVKGKANAHLVTFLSKHWKIPRASIEIRAGITGRSKRLRIFNPTDELRNELLSIGNRQDPVM